MFTMILSAISGQLGSIVSLIMNNKIARYAALAVLLLVGLWFINKHLTANAYEQGKNEGARQAWVQATAVQEKTWADAQQAIDKAKADAAAAVKVADAARANNDKQHAVAVAHTAEVVQKADAQVAQAEKIVTQVIQDPTMPSKEELIGAFKDFEAAYKALEGELQYTEQQYDESVKYANDSIIARNAQIDSLQKDLDLTKKELQFYKDGFDQVSHKHKGFGHFMKKVFTLGIAR